MQTDFSEEKSQSLYSQKIPAVSITNVRNERKKNVTLNVIKTFGMQPEIGPKHFGKP